MEKTWIAAVAVDDLMDNDVTGIDVDGNTLAFYRINGEVFVTDSVCTHGSAQLCDGFLRITRLNVLSIKEDLTCAAARLCARP